ncbi:sulfur oxidation c-type cytochrome SoxX [Sulfurospirillum sp. 1307]|jgi:sulfur-oxidizing protein SoxX
MGLVKKIAFFSISAAMLVSTANAGTMSKEDMIKEGRKVFVTKKLGNCLACHAVQGDSSIPQTGSLGPKLANLDTYPRDYLVEKVWDPNKTNPNTIMPPMGRNHKITKEQVEAVVTYLQEVTKAK